MEFGLLGPLQVRRSGLLVPVPAGKLRGVLAALLLNAGRVVSTDDLAGVLWGAGVPRSARVTLANYVKRLRQLSERNKKVIEEANKLEQRLQAESNKSSRFSFFL